MVSARTRLCAGVVGLAFVLSSCGPAEESPDTDRGLAAPAQKMRTGDFAVPAQLDPDGQESASAAGPTVPGLGPETSAQIPAGTTQVIVVSSPGRGRRYGTRHDEVVRGEHPRRNLIGLVP